MEWRTKLGALLGAGGLVMLATSAAFAAQTYTIDVTKTADPAAVPIAGASVEYTVWVENTGSGFFQVVTVDDGMAGCTLGSPAGDDGDGKLESGETWAYTCTVAGVTPGTQNTASVNACHDQSACVDSHDATDSDSVTVTEGDPGTEPPVTEPPATFSPTLDVAPATEPTTDAEFGAGSVGGGSNALILVVALALLLGSLVLVTPARPIRQR